MWRLMCHGLQSSGVCLCRQYLGPLGAQLDEVDQQLVLFLRELFDRMASSHLRNPFGDRFLEFRRDSECRAPSSGLPTDPSDGPEHAPAAGIEKKKPPGQL